MVRAPYAELVAPVVTRGGLQLMLDRSRTRANIYFVVISGFPANVIPISSDTNSTYVAIFNFPDTLIACFLQNENHISNEFRTEGGYQFLPLVK